MKFIKRKINKKTIKKPSKDLRKKRIKRNTTYKKGGACGPGGCSPSVSTGPSCPGGNCGAGSCPGGNCGANIGPVGPSVSSKPGTVNQSQYNSENIKQMAYNTSAIADRTLNVAENVGNVGYNAAQGAIAMTDRLGENVIEKSKAAVQFAKSMYAKDYSLFEGRPLYEKICGNISRLFILKSNVFESTINSAFKELFESGTVKDRFNTVFKEAIDEMIENDEMKQKIDQNIENKILEPVSEYIHNQLVGADPSITKERILDVLKKDPEKNISTFGVGADMAMTTIDPLTIPPVMNNPNNAISNMKLN